MPLIETQTFIKAEIQVVFDLSRSIDLHKISTSQTREEAIAGRTSGLIELGESVTWRARHFGIFQQLSVHITQFDQPHSFTDEMLRGAFKSFRHQHLFTEQDGGTLMTDRFDYQSPLGILGKLADWIFLKKYMTRFLIQRNEVIREFAESGEWRKISGI
ncbi:MAG: SRPBCC family protein [Bacteroidia bacterium]|nr:SRPBCC family protein [Bacteroidia bacterium]